MFYNIVVGWILKYFVLSGTGKLKTIDKDTYFNQFAGSSASIPWDAIAIVLTVAVICAGVITCDSIFIASGIYGRGKIFTAAEMASFAGGRYMGYGAWTGILYGIA